tara:strand:+ start:101647 stop:102480 length:834 start_codon:yes stop_codon:yes gene_type:complete
MANLVGVYAASHTPVMLNFPDAIEEGDRVEVFDAFTRLGQKIKSADPDVVVILSDDHMHNFFLNNMPAFCIGATNGYKTPVEHWLKAEKRVLEGDPDLGAYLVNESMKAGFDPSFSMDLTLDHGVLTPLELAGIADSVCIVPVLVNCVQPPLPSLQRTLDFGYALGDAIRRYPNAERIAVLATGGLSHDLSTPRMGMVNAEFDQRFLSLLAKADDAELVRYATDHVDEAGNGTEEIRTWLMAYGIAASRRFQCNYYKPLANWYTGIGLGEWVEAEQV